MHIMANTEKYPYKRVIQMDHDMKDAIRAFRFEHQLLSDAEALRQLVLAGLEVNSERGDKRAARR